MDRFLGIDLGTSAVRVILLDEAGRPLALGEKGFPTHHPSPGFIEQAPSDWWQATVDCIRAVFANNGLDAGDVRSIGLSGRMHGVVFLGEKGEPLCDAIVWPDSRTASICEEWERAGHGELFLPITGLPLYPGLPALSVEWLRRNHHDIFRSIRMLLLPKDFVRLKLTGRAATDPSDASGSSLFDIVQRQWSEPVLDTLALDGAILPAVLESMSVAGELTAEAARETGLQAGIPVATGGADHAMAAVALDLRDSGQVALALGTGGTVTAPTEHPITDARLHTLCHADGRHWLLKGTTLSAASALAWFNETILSGSPLPAPRGAEAAVARSKGHFTTEELTALAAASPAGANGLFFLPYLDGELTPHMTPRSRASFVGLSLEHTTADMARAIMEGVTYSLLDSVELFRRLGVEAEEVLCFAEGAKSTLWRQIIAEVFGVPVHWHRFSDYAATGAARTGARAIGMRLPARELDATWIDTRRPHGNLAERYGRGYKTFKHLYRQLSPLFDELVSARE